MLHLRIEGTKELATKIHEALRGTPAYQGTEIILYIDGTYKDRPYFDLYIGNENGDDITLYASVSF